MALASFPTAMMLHASPKEKKRLASVARMASKVGPRSSLEVKRCRMTQNGLGLLAKTVAGAGHQKESARAEKGLLCTMIA